MSPAIWQLRSDEWQPLLPSGFPSEEKLHDLVEESPNLLPLSGDPNLTILGREVSVGAGYADLIGIETSGRLVVIEIKLRKNAEARRAVVAQLLTYAAFLKGQSVSELEQGLRAHLNSRDAGSIADLVQRSDQTGDFDPDELEAGLAAALVSGGFRLVLVLDEAPSELVQLVGYLESISSEIVVDLITVSAYEAGGERLMVPQRVDPDYRPEASAPAHQSKPRVTTRDAIEGSEAFAEAAARAPDKDHRGLERLLSWAQALEAERLVTLRTYVGKDRQILLMWVPGQKAGLVSIWNDGGPSISVWRSVFVRLAWDHLGRLEELIGSSVGQGSAIRNPSDEVLAAVSDAYRTAASGQPAWNGNDYYVSFGEGPNRLWDEARRWGFVGAGGGEWYSKTLRQLQVGNRVFVYIPRGRGVAGYVGVGEVTGAPRVATDLEVETEAGPRAYSKVTESEWVREVAGDPDLEEWVAPVRWISTRSKEEAIKDSDFFANQNSAVKLTHGYTLRKLLEAFDLTE